MTNYTRSTKPISLSRLPQSLAAIWVPYCRAPLLFGALPTLHTAWSSTFNLFGNFLLPPYKPKVELDSPITLCTLTINPDLARLWHYFAQRALDSRVEIVIVDSSGQLQQELVPGAKIIRLWNFSHSRKIDYLLCYVFKNRYVWLCDDDVMIMSKEALRKSIDLSKTDKKVAVVSFIPNDVDLVIEGQQHRGMGSYCLLLDRKAFIEEQLSFSPGKSSNSLLNRGTGYYDTGDYANETLLRRGYKVRFLIGHENEYEYVCGLDGVDSARLRLLSGRESFIREIKQVDVRTARHRIIGAYCNWKVVELYREVFSQEPRWTPPLSVDELYELVGDLGEYYIDAIGSQFKLYDMRTEILKQTLSGIAQNV